MSPASQKFTNSKQKAKFKSRLLLLALLAILVVTLLAACGDTPLPGNQGGPAATATPAPSTTSPGTTAAPTTVAPTAVPTTIQQAQTIPATVNVPLPTVTPGSTSQPQPTATQQPATTPPSQPATTKPTEPATTAAPAYNPVIRFSTTSVMIGGSLVVSGSGFPAGAKLDVSLVLPEIGLAGPYANPSVDTKGNFNATVVLASYPNGKVLTPGKVVLKVSTQDGKLSASAPLTLAAGPTDYKPLLVSSLVKVQLNQEIVLTGSGFPANLSLEVVGGVQNLNELYGNVKTDANGKFSLKVKLPNNTGIQPGLYFIYASSADFKFQAKVKLDVQPAAYAPALSSSLLQVKLGQEIVLTGRGFPANLTLDVVGGVQNPNEKYGSVKSDAQGNFLLKVKLPANSGIALGQYFIYASSADFKYQSNVELNVIK